MRFRGRLAALAVLAGVWLLASGPAAAAHGTLQSSEPAGGSSLERAPAAVTLRFSERPDPGLSTVRVLDSGGRVVAGGRAGRGPDDQGPDPARVGELVEKLSNAKNPAMIAGPDIDMCGGWDAAVKLAEKILQTDKSNRIARLVVGVRALKQKNYTAAQQSIASAGRTRLPPAASR